MLVDEEIKVVCDGHTYVATREGRLFSGETITIKDTNGDVIATVETYDDIETIVIEYADDTPTTTYDYYAYSETRYLSDLVHWVILTSYH